MKFKFMKKDVLIMIAWFIVVLAVMFVSRNTFRTVSMDDYNDGTAELYTVDLYENKISQTVTISDKVQKFSFLMINDSKENQVVTISVKDVKTQQVLNSVEKELLSTGGEELVVEWQFVQRERFPENIIVEVMSNVDAAEKLSICVQDRTFDAVYTENDEMKDAHIRMAVIYNQGYNLVLMVMTAIMLLCAGYFLLLEGIQKISVEKIYLVVLLCSGLVFAFSNPFGQEADGWTHFTRSMDVSYGNLLSPFIDNNGNNAEFMMPENVNEIGFRIVQPGSGQGGVFTKHIKNLYFSNEVAEQRGVGGFSSFFYLPQAIGLFIARILGLSVYWHMIFGRVCNLLIYGLLSYYGLKKMPVYKNIYIVISLLPMSLYQAASFSYDSFLNALCFVFIALSMNYAYEKESVNCKDVLKLGIILALLLICKYVYASIGLLVFIIPMKKFGTSKDYWKAFAIALIPVVMMAVHVLSGFLVVSDPVTTTEVSQVAEMTQMQYVMSNPVAFVKTYIYTLFVCFTTYVRQLNILGWLNYSLGNLEFIVPILMGTVAVVDTNNIKEKILTKDKVLFFLTFMIVVSVGMTGLYLMDTVANPVGAGVILGYQGRYTIPVLMLLLATFASRNITNTIKNFSYKIVGVMGFVLSYAAVSLMQVCF